LPGNLAPLPLLEAPIAIMRRPGQGGREGHGSPVQASDLASLALTVQLLMNIRKETKRDFFNCERSAYTFLRFHPFLFFILPRGELGRKATTLIDIASDGKNVERRREEITTTTHEEDFSRMAFILSRGFCHPYCLQVACESRANLGG
jgi:hypothetical protein